MRAPSEWPPRSKRPASGAGREGAPPGQAPAHRMRRPLRERPRGHRATHPGRLLERSSQRPPAITDRERCAPERTSQPVPRRGARPQRHHLAELRDVASRAPRPVERPGPGQGRRAVGTKRARRHRRPAERRPHPTQQAGRAPGRRHPQMEGRSGEPVEGRPVGRHRHPRVRSEAVAKPGDVPRGAGVGLDAHREVAERITKQRFHRRRHPLRPRTARLDRRHVHRHRVDPPARPRPHDPVRDEVRHLRPLAEDAIVPPPPRLAARIPVPGPRVAHRHEQPSGDVRPVRELPVLAPVAVERLVARADLPVERPAHGEVVPGGRAEDVVIPGREIAGAREQPLPVVSRVAPLPALRGHAGAHRRRIHPRGIGVGAEAEGERVRHRVVTARMRRHQPVFGDHVAVEEHQDLVARLARAEVAGAGEAEAAAALPHHAHLEPRARRRRGRRPRPVVHHHHLQQLARVALALERREGERELARRLVVRHHHRHPLARLERGRVGHRHLPPVVVAHRVRRRTRRPLVAGGVHGA